MFKNLIFFVVVLIVSSVSAGAINHRQEIDTAQKWANEFQRPYPILIFNRDELNFLFLSKSAVGDSDEKQHIRQNIIKDFVFQKTQVQISLNDASNIDDSVYASTDSALALPIKDYDSSKYKICAVFPISPNSDAQGETERITGLNVKKAFTTETDYSQISKKMDFESLYLFSLYHEVSHCLDQTFMPLTLDGSYSQDPHTTHLSEAFAETLAYLKISSRVGTDVAIPRALYRTIYSRIIGEYLANNPQFGMGNELVTYGGAIYFLTPYLLEAYQALALKLKNTPPKDPQPLMDLALQVIKSAEIDSRAINMIVYSFKNGVTATHALYEPMVFENPQFFAKGYNDYVSYISFTDLWLSKSFLEKKANSQQNSTVTPELPLEQLCSALKNQNSLDFLNSIDNFREKLSQNDYEQKSRQQRTKELTKLSLTLSSQCI